ncbi:MAG: hypothetical protein K0S55_1521 [Clostridia bacterium]|nr:hypothetical protein [Clostridia bacterium]
MKKIYSILFCILFILITSCDNNVKEIEISQDKIDIYGQLSGFKGIELYAWLDEETNEILCGLLEGTNRNKEASDFEILYNKPLTVSETREILSRYEKDMFVIVNGIEEPLSEDIIKKLKKEFDNLGMKNINYLEESDNKE